MTNNSGTYTITNVNSGLSGPLIPAKTGYTFSPTSIYITNISSNLTGKNFTATSTNPNSYRISGKTKEYNGTPIPYATVTFTGLPSVTSASDGAYYKDVNAGWSGTVSAIKTGYTFSTTTINSISSDMPNTHIFGMPLNQSPQINVSPTSLSFGNVQINTVSTLTFTISNTGNATLNVSSISVPTGYSVSGWVAGGISPGGNETTNVHFQPTQAVTYNGSIVVNSNAENSGGNTINVSGTGSNSGGSQIDANFIATITAGDAPLTTHFIDTSTPSNTATSWQWDFDNNGTIDSEEHDPYYTYTLPGSYSVSLTVSDGISSDSKTILNYIQVGGETLHANFTSDVNNGAAPLEVQFTDISTGNPNLWQWDFDNDGSIDSYQQHPTWIYTEPGTYSVELIVSNGSISDTEIKEDYIIVIGNDGLDQYQLGYNYGFSCSNQYHRWQVFYPTRPCLSKIEIFLHKGGVPTTNLIVKIMNGSGTQTLAEKLIFATNIPYYDWYVVEFNQTIAINQGEAYRIDLTLQNPLGTDNFIAWRGSTTSDYPGINDVSDAWPDYDYAFKTYGICSTSSITANFTASPLTGGSPLTCHFTDTSTSSNPIMSWQWDFENDGIIDSNEQNPSYTYTLPGVYDVSLTVGDGTNYADKTEEGFITVTGGGEALLIADFAGEPQSGQAPLTVTFSDASTEVNTTITEWSWDFDNDWLEDASGPGPHEFTYDYPSPGYTVSLTISDGTLEAVETKGDYITVTGDTGWPTVSGPALVFKVVSEIDDVNEVAINASKTYNYLTTNYELIDSHGFVVFDTEFLSSFFNEQDEDEILRIDLMDFSDHIKAHMAFKYTKEQFLNNEKIDAIIYVHDLLSGKINGDGWDYYYNELEKPASMLIPPGKDLSSIDPTRQPLLLVHGVGGSYPYWGNTPNTINNFHDTWQFYYPYDGDITTSGMMLSQAIPKILNGDVADEMQPYASNRIHVVVHSMGGLVTRSYIQNHTGDTRIKKFLMLGTPNHGAFIAYRMYYDGFFDISGEILLNKDTEALAYKQMTPGSDFLFDLFDSDPRDLFPGAVRNETYLVIAGTHDETPLLHDEIHFQEDGVVGVSSASMLEYNIPLATIHHSHSGFIGDGLTSDIPVWLINSFLVENHNPDNPIFLNSVNGYWRYYGDTIKPDDPNMREDRGILLVKIPGSTVNKVDMGLSADESNALSLFSSGANSSNRLQGIPNTDQYFSVNLDNIIHVNEIGIGFPDQSYTVRFKRIVPELDWIHTYKIAPNAFHFKHLLTTSVGFSFSPGELMFLNSTNDIEISSNASRNATLNIHVDNSINEIAFLIGKRINAGSIQNHQMILTTPSNLQIDPTYANNDPDMEFKENIEEGFVFYYVNNPEPGEWIITHNDQIDLNVTAPINSAFKIELTTQDSLYAVYETVEFEILLPNESTILNPQLTATIYYLPDDSGTEWLNLGAVETIFNAGEMAFYGEYVPTLGGTFRIVADFSGQLDNENITRSTSGTFYVDIESMPTVTADFIATPTTGEIPLTVGFADMSSATNTTITSWSWNFGDGFSSTEQNPNHMYLNAGTYTVSLTVTSWQGLTDTKTRANYIQANAPLPCNPPSYISASEGTYTGYVRISWSANREDDKSATDKNRPVSRDGECNFFRVYRNNIGTTNGAQAVSGWQSLSYFNDTEAQPGQNYFYWVKTAKNEIGTGESSFSSPVMGWRKLSPPANVSATDGTLLNAIQVSWPPVPGASYYRVFRSGSGAVESATEISDWQSAMTITDTDVEPTIPYYYWVQAAVSADGQRPSDLSVYDYGHADGDFRCKAPLNTLVADGTSTNHTEITWDGNGSCGFFRVYRHIYNEPTNAIQISGNTWFTETSYLDTGATPGQTYYYWIRSGENATGYNQSGYSGGDFGWRQITSPTVTATNNTICDRIVLQWSSTPGANYYRVYRSTMDNAQTAVPICEWQNYTGYTDFEVVSLTNYYYWVLGANDSEGTNASDFNSVSALGRACYDPTCPAPTEVSASDGTMPGLVRITWESASDCGYYRVYRHHLENVYQSSLLNNWSQITSFDDTTAQANRTYYYWVQAARTSAGQNSGDYSDGDEGYVVVNGDVNSDGVFDQIDLTMIVEYILGTANLNSSQIGLADVNDDGRLNIADVTILVEWTEGDN